MWYEHPNFIAAVMGIGIALMALLASWFNNKKGSIDRSEKEAVLRAKLLTLKQEWDIKEQQRLNALKLAEQTAESVKEMKDTQTAMAVVLDATHTATNSAREALERLLAEVRAQLKSTEVELSSEKLLHVAELATKTQRIDDITRQLTDMALKVPAPSADEAVKVAVVEFPEVSRP